MIERRKNERTNERPTERGNERIHAEFTLECVTGSKVGRCMDVAWMTEFCSERIITRSTDNQKSEKFDIAS